MKEGRSGALGKGSLAEEPSYIDQCRSLVKTVLRIWGAG